MTAFAREDGSRIGAKAAPAAQVSGRFHAVSLVAATVVVLLLPFIAYTRLMLFSFYVRGSYLLDSGLFADLLWHSDLTLTQPASAGGGSYFAVHFTPIFLPVAMLSRLLPLSMPQYFSVFIAAVQSLLAFAVFWMVLSGDRERRVATHWLAALAGIGFAFSGLAINIVRYPHFETLIPAFFLLFITAMGRGQHRLAAVFFSCGLFVREDAGLHYLAVLGLLALFDFTRGVRLREQRVLLRFAAAGLVYSLVAMLAQRMLFPDHASSFALVYLGDPPLAHLTLEGVQRRLLYFIVNRSYVLFPLLVVVLWARIARAPFLAIGYIACLPWLLLQLLAASPFAATLSSYYAFPCLIGMAWPLASVFPNRRETISRTLLLLGFATTILLTFVPGHDIHDPGRLAAPDAFFEALPSAAQQADIERAVATVSAARPELGRLFADNSIVALKPGGFARTELEITPGMGHGSIEAADTVVFFSDGYDAPHLRAIADAAGLSKRYAVPGTPVHLATHLDLTAVAGLRGLIVPE